MLYNNGNNDNNNKNNRNALNTIEMKQWEKKNVCATQGTIERKNKKKNWMKS
jgi:hypothetical protein